MYSNASPEYLIVIRRFVDLGHRENWRRDETLSEITDDYRVVAKEDIYVVFDLTKKKRVL